MVGCVPASEPKFLIVAGLFWCPQFLDCSYLRCSLSTWSFPLKTPNGIQWELWTNFILPLPCWTSPSGSPWWTPSILIRFPHPIFCWKSHWLKPNQLIQSLESNCLYDASNCSGVMPLGQSFSWGLVISGDIRYRSIVTWYYIHCIQCIYIYTEIYRTSSKNWNLLMHHESKMYIIVYQTSKSDWDFSAFLQLPIVEGLERPVTSSAKIPTSGPRRRIKAIWEHSNGPRFRKLPSNVKHFDVFQKNCHPISTSLMTLKHVFIIFHMSTSHFFVDLCLGEKANTDVQDTNCGKLPWR